MNDPKIQATKLCGKCRETKSADAATFHRNRSQADGWHHTCKSCRKLPSRPRGLFTDAEFYKRFWRRVDKNCAPPSHVPHLGACWAWVGSIGVTTGYGKVWRSHPRVEMLAHRVAWEFFHGPIRCGLFVCHRCDNRRCVNPDHLFLGTQRDNMRDCAAKGRYNANRGTSAYQARLTEADVAVIRRESAAGTSDKELAARFGVCRGNIYQIRMRRSWRHVA